MKITIHGQTFNVSWRHFSGKKTTECAACHQKTPAINDRFTVCDIRDEKHNLLFSEYAYCHPKDAYVRRTGRLASFERAAHELADRIIPKLPTELANTTRRSMIGQIWKQYELAQKENRARSTNAPVRKTEVA